MLLEDNKLETKSGKQSKITNLIRNQVQIQINRKRSSFFEISEKFQSIISDAQQFKKQDQKLSFQTNNQEEIMDINQRLSPAFSNISQILHTPRFLPKIINFDKDLDKKYIIGINKIIQQDDHFEDCNNNSSILSDELKNSIMQEKQKKNILRQSQSEKQLIQTNSKKPSVDLLINLGQIRKNISERRNPDIKFKQRRKGFVSQMSEKTLMQQKFDNICSLLKQDEQKFYAWILSNPEQKIVYKDETGLSDQHERAIKQQMHEILATRNKNEQYAENQIGKLKQVQLQQGKILYLETILRKVQSTRNITQDIINNQQLSVRLSSIDNSIQQKKSIIKFAKDSEIIPNIKEKMEQVRLRKEQLQKQKTQQTHEMIYKKSLEYRKIQLKKKNFELSRKQLKKKIKVFFNFEKCFTIFQQIIKQSLKLKMIQTKVTAKIIKIQRQTRLFLFIKKFQKLSIFKVNLLRRMIGKIKSKKIIQSYLKIKEITKDSNSYQELRWFMIQK